LSDNQWLGLVVRLNICYNCKINKSDMNADTSQPQDFKTDKTFYGKKLISWKAPDYHTYDRGIGWYIIFGLLTFGTALITFLTDPASSGIPVACICLVAAFYLWVHREGEVENEVTLYENGIDIDGSRLMSWKDFDGYWFIEDQHSRLLVLESNLWNQDRVRILLGKNKTDKIVKAMEKIELVKMAGKRENSFDLWSRVLRL